MIYIAPNIRLSDHEVEFNATLAQGPGGQNVNKVNTAIQLRFDITTSSLPREVKQRLLRMADTRITKDGVLVIKAKEERSQLRNRDEALERLKAIIRQALVVPKKRIATRPKKSSVRKRLDSKTKRGLIKQQRKSVTDD
ncbi:alternative ribosome rescue aminoacyl-tRNA hydrolase ArfB [Gammaproteobacteria bacterium]|jgi:ribosome-associated protein|nr:alternative ribosome rescue aminoacyl-tRNA hydrolase ArfB [Gammaproteobacteria bacterium]